MSAKHYSTDVVIVGAGPVGLFAVFECGMLKMKCHVVDSLEHIGGQLSALYPEKPIYDIPGYPLILARDLVAKLEAQADPFAPVYHLNQQVAALQRRDDGRYDVTTATGAVINCAAVIIAAGAGAFGPNRPPLPGIEAYEGRSVFYMVRKREAFADKTIMIAGGGDSAVDWAISLADSAKKIYFVHRRDKFRAAPESVDKLQKIAATGKVEMVIPYQMQKLVGDHHGRLCAVELADLDGKARTIETDILLPLFGIVPQLGVLGNWGVTIEHHHIPVDPSTQQTNLPGIFAIGDIATYRNKVKLILVGFSEAAMAARAIYPLVFPGQELHFIYSTTQGVP